MALVSGNCNLVHVVEDFYGIVVKRCLYTTICGCHWDKCKTTAFTGMACQIQ